jgi:methylenetetrahydrofolate dehydrogenase (NADP+)/methenyltetrahydrofolate cyclohydrolase
MRIIDIKSLIELYDQPLLEENVALLQSESIQPGLAVVKTSRDPGAASYIRGIRKACANYDVYFEEHLTETQDDLWHRIDALNVNPAITAIIVMYPTPFDIHDREFMNKVDPDKDLEGLTSINLGYLVQFKKFIDPFGLRKLVIPPTATGILYVLKRYSFVFDAYFDRYGVFPYKQNENVFSLLGKKVTIVNDSLAVGKSLALMMMNENASARVCQKYTDIQDIYHFTRYSDIIISAVPVNDWTIPKDHVPTNAILFDVAFVGNFDYPDILYHCFCIAPRWDLTDKGNRINDMTLTRLISNALYLANKKLPDPVLKQISDAQQRLQHEAVDKHLDLIRQS